MAKKPETVSTPYLPVPATIERVESISAAEKLFYLSCGGVTPYLPGQFFMVGLPGYGEAPISVCAPFKKGAAIELCIRRAGNLTGALHRLVAGERLWLRGAYGHGFDTALMKGRGLLFITGGIGIAPMRSLLLEILEKRDEYRELRLLYGAKRPDELIFTDDFARWKRDGLNVNVTVDEPQAGYRGAVGLVTDLIGRLKVEPKSTTAVVIGPPVMYRFVVARLKRMGLSEEEIYLSLERRMKCGVGKCGHCQINSSYVCQDGPVYSLDSLAGMGEAFK